MSRVIANDVSHYINLSARKKTQNTLLSCFLHGVRLIVVLLFSSSKFMYSLTSFVITVLYTQGFFFPGGTRRNGVPAPFLTQNFWL
jgi:hypothetical protein